MALDHGPLFRILDPTAGRASVFGHDTVAGAESAKALNIPPPGFTALFNGQDFTGWRLSPKAKAIWSIEDGVLKARALLDGSPHVTVEDVRRLAHPTLRHRILVGYRAEAEGVEQRCVYAGRSSPPRSRTR